jgi:hypothetical protein
VRSCKTLDSTHNCTGEGRPESAASVSTNEGRGECSGCVRFELVGPGNALERFQLLRALTALSILKYSEETIDEKMHCLSASDAVKRLFKDNIEPYASLSLCDDFRTREFYGPGINDAFAPYIYNLRVVFDAYTTERFTQVVYFSKRWLVLSEPTWDCCCS